MFGTFPFLLSATIALPRPPRRPFTKGIHRVRRMVRSRPSLQMVTFPPGVSRLRACTIEIDNRIHSANISNPARHGGASSKWNRLRDDCGTAASVRVEDEKRKSDIHTNMRPRAACGVNPSKPAAWHVDFYHDQPRQQARNATEKRVQSENPMEEDEDEIIRLLR